MRLTHEPSAARRTSACLYAGCFLLVLAMSYGFVITGDDWFFAARAKQLDLFALLRLAFDTARQHYLTTNGRLLGNFLAGLAGGPKLLRELLRCTLIVLIFRQLRRLAGTGRLSADLLGFALLIALPAAVSAQTYAWATGFFNYVPPALLVLLYVSAARQTLERKERRGAHPLWMLLLGITSQLFVEHVSVSLCLLSLAICLYDAHRQKHISAGLAAHWIGTALGCAVMFLAPGYRNIGHEGYRALDSTLSGLLQTAERNSAVLLQSLTGDNWPLVVLTSLAAAAMLLTGHSEDRPWKRPLTLALLICAPIWFYGSRILPQMAWLDRIVHLLYFAALLMSVRCSLRDAKRRAAAQLMIIGIVLFTAPLLFVTPVGPRCMYLQNVLLVGLFWLLAGEAARRLPLQQLRPAVLIAACLLLAGCLFVYVENGKAEHVRKELATQAVEQGSGTVLLPDYPHPEYVHTGDPTAMGYYYYNETPGDLSFAFVPWSEWSADELPPTE